MSKAVADEKFWNDYKLTEEEMQMRVAISPHHTNPRSATLDFWRKTSKLTREHRAENFVSFFYLTRKLLQHSINVILKSSVAYRHVTIS